MRIILVFWPVTDSIFDSRYRQKPKAMEYNNAHNCFGPALVSKHIFQPCLSFWAWACNWSIWRATQAPAWTFDPVFLMTPILVTMCLFTPALEKTTQAHCIG